MVAFPYRYVSKPLWCLVGTLLVASATSVLLIGCGGSGGKLPNSMGPIQPITIKAQFPSAQGRAHDTITSAWVGVTGPGMTPITQQMTYDASTFSATVTVDVPTGSDRTFQVDAKDAEDAIVFTGQTTGVELIGGETIQLDMTVEAAFTEPTPSAIDYTKMTLERIVLPSGWARTVIFSPDGMTVMIASGVGAHSVDRQTGAVKKEFAPADDIGSYIATVALTLDGNILATGSRSGQVKLWDVHTGELIRTLDRIYLSQGWTHFLPVAFSPDGNTLAVGGTPDKMRPGSSFGGGQSASFITLFDVQTGAVLRTLDTGVSGHAVAFSPDGMTLAAGGGGQVNFWDAQTGTLKNQVDVYSVASIAFSPDGNTLVVGGPGGAGGNVTLMDVQTGTLKETQAPGITYAVAFSPDGSTVATGGGRPYNVKLWDAQTGALKLTLVGHEDIIMSVAFSPDGRTLASGQMSGNGAKLWSVP